MLIFILDKDIFLLKYIYIYCKLLTKRVYMRVLLLT